MPEKKKKLKTGVIRQKVLIPNSSPEAVYRAMLSSMEHSAFTGSEAKVSARVGAKFTAWDGYITGKNLELEPGKKIVQEWRTSEWPEDYEPSTLRITLTRKKNDGTELAIVQTNVPQSQVSMYDEGWHTSYWEPMKEYFANKKKTDVV